MEKNRKLGYLLLGGLVLATVAARAAYAPVSLGVLPAPEIKLPSFAPPKPAWLAKADHLPPGQPGVVQLTTELDRTALLKNGENEVHVAVTVDTHGLGVGAHVPTDFIVVFDHSGSMGGQKIEYGKQALRELIRRLDDRDRFSLVAYDSEADVRVPLGEEAQVARTRWLRAVEGLDIAGGTNMSSGLDLGLAQLNERRASGRAARVLLLSDGLANQGDTTLDGLGARARRMTQADSVLSTIGIGADFDENVMTALARTGAGAFYYLAKLETLPQLLNAELKTASETYAQAAELVVKLPPGVRLVSASGKSFSREGDTAIVPLGSLYSDYSQQLWLSVAVPNAKLSTQDVGSISLRYRRDAQPFEVKAAELPKIEVVADSSSFEQRIVKPVWERAMLEDELTKSREQMGAAIRSGNAGDVDRAVQSAEKQRSLALRLGSRRVLEDMDNIHAAAAPAKAAQAAGGTVRMEASKSAAAQNYAARNASSYKNVAPTLSYR